MRKRYIIHAIVHSGRKGIRGTEVTDDKYEGLIGSRISLNPEEIKQFQPITWYFKYHRYYDYWTTSEVLATDIKTEEDKRLFVIETANTIYELEEED